MPQTYFVKCSRQVSKKRISSATSCFSTPMTMKWMVTASEITDAKYSQNWREWWLLHWDLIASFLQIHNKWKIQQVTSGRKSWYSTKIEKKDNENTVLCFAEILIGLNIRQKWFEGSEFHNFSLVHSLIRRKINCQQRYSPKPANFCFRETISNQIPVMEVLLHFTDKYRPGCALWFSQEWEKKKKKTWNTRTPTCCIRQPPSSFAFNHQRLARHFASLLAPPPCTDSAATRES